MKKRHPSITPVCAFCQHAVLAQPPDAPSFTFAFPEEEVAILCPYRKNITYGDSCRRFCFDPLKYKPKSPPLLLSLSEEDIL